jgi:hypothetical protein
VWLGLFCGETGAKKAEKVAADEVVWPSAAFGVF